MSRQSHRKHRQSGFTMTELMVAITLGLLLLTAVGQVFVGSRQAFRTQEGVGEVQENGRFAIDIISRQIRQAGYRPQPLQPLILAAALPGAVVPPGFSANRIFVAGTDNGATAGVLAGTDTLSIAYQGALAGTGITRNCMGNNVPANSTVVNTFFIDSNKELRCSTLAPIAAAANPLSNSQPLLAGIADMQIVYGIDDRGCGQSTAPGGFRYVTAAQIGNQWCAVHNVRIVITAESLESIDSSFPNQGRLRRTYTTTINLRNSL